MEATVTVDLSKFNTACAIYSSELKKTPREVVSEQSGLLMVDLGRNLPPRDPDKTKANIEKSVYGKFGIISTIPRLKILSFKVKAEGKSGHGDVLWLGANSNALFGVAKEKDMTRASAEDLRTLYYTVTKTGKQRAGHHGKQTVYISQKVTTKQSTLKKLVKMIQDRVGLLRASFCVGLSEVNAKQQPPAFVKKLIPKAKGSFINGLGLPGKAEFTIISNAAGVSDEKAVYFLQGALNRRGESMMSRIAYLQRQAKTKAGFN